ncbi:hypothetical protein AGMMS50293_17920 [Spirochaetia bacterium]|nr:hypothetical protein AGMMS50293_17920 [Spirochaetia bacterium]
MSYNILSIIPSGIIGKLINILGLAELHKFPAVCILFLMIRHLLFDLDDTIYPPPATAGMYNRIIDYTTSLLGLNREEAEKIWIEKNKIYGSTLTWYQSEFNFTNAGDFLAQVHPPEELEEITFDPDLRNFLLSLNMPMTILTNGSEAHAIRILEYLKVADLFREIWAIERLDFRGKPQSSAYQRVFSSGDFTLEDTVYFDDNPKYVEAYTRLGGRAVLVTPREAILLPGVPRVNSIYEIPQVLGEIG